MKVLIQGLGEVPIPVELALKKVKPDIIFIICSDYQLRHIHPVFSKSNWNVVTEAARKVNAKVVFKRCDVFDPKAIRDCLFDVLKSVDPTKDELVFNYTSGSAPVRLFLGSLGVQLSKLKENAKIMYTIKYKEEGVEISKDHAHKLKEFLPTDIDVLLDLFFKKGEKKFKVKRPKRLRGRQR